jgi:hypothetical protein
MSLKFALFAALSVGLELPTEAHDIYSHLNDATGASCCNDRDCRPAPFRVTPTGVQMLVNGEWLKVPDDAIQYRSLLGDSGETGGGHWCGSVRDAHGNRVLHLTHCAVLPPNSAMLADPEAE